MGRGVQRERERAARGCCVKCAKWIGQVEKIGSASKAFGRERGNGRACEKYWNTFNEKVRRRSRGNKSKDARTPRSVDAAIEQTQQSWCDFAVSNTHTHTHSSENKAATRAATAAAKWTLLNTDCVLMPVMDKLTRSGAQRKRERECALNRTEFKELQLDSIDMSIRQCCVTLLTVLRDLFC